MTCCRYGNGGIDSMYATNILSISSADLVVASAGEDCKISLWRKNGQVIGVVPQPGGEADDNIDVSDQMNVPSCSISEIAHV